MKRNLPHKFLLLVKKSLLLFFLLFTASFSSKSQAFQNPIRDGAADPFITYHNGFYYMTYTTVDHLEIVKAGSLADLKSTPATWVYTSGDPNRGQNIWAPELHRLNGPNGYRWYLYYTGGANPCCDNQRMHVLESVGDDPMGPYHYKARIFDNTHDVYAIDGSVFQRPDGSLFYMYTTNYTGSLRIASMINPWTMNSPGVEIATPTYPWETISGNTNEGPIVLHRNGRYFIVYSGNNCGSPDYSLGMLTADENSNLLDPISWVKSPEAVFKKAPGNNVFGPGHHGFFKSPCGNEDWIVYHAVSDPNGACDGSRSARAQKFTWNADGTPNFGTPFATGVNIPLPSGDPKASVGCGAQSPYNGSPIVLPGTVEAENFDNGGEGVAFLDADPQNRTNAYRIEGVDIEASTEGGYNINYSEDGEWLEYTVNISQPGSYQINTRVASMLGGSFHIEFNGQDVSGPIAVPNTGGWQNWQTVSATTNLSVGTQVMRFYISQGGFNTNNISFSYQGGNGIVSGEVYRLVARHSNQVLDVSGCSNADGANVQQWPWLNSACQRWRIEATDNGFYRLISQQSGKVLDVDGCSNANGANVHQWPYWGGACQQWAIEPTGNGFYRLISRQSGLALEVGSAAMTNGSNVNQWPWNGSACQEWKVENVNNVIASNLFASGKSTIKKTEAIQGFKIYPNPADDHVRIDAPAFHGETVQISVISLNGTEVYSKEVKLSGSTHLNTSTLKAGFYLVLLENNQINIKHKLIISH